MMPVTISGVTYQIGAGLFANSNGKVAGARYATLGTGISLEPIYSQKPGGTGGADAYIPHQRWIGD